MWLLDMYLFEYWSEDKQKKKKRQKDKVEVEGSTLQRSKTFVSLLFKSGRRRERSSSRDRKVTGTVDRQRGRSKSPKHLDNEPGELSQLTVQHLMRATLCVIYEFAESFHLKMSF